MTIVLTGEDDPPPLVLNALLAEGLGVLAAELEPPEDELGGSVADTVPPDELGGSVATPVSSPEELGGPVAGAMVVEELGKFVGAAVPREEELGGSVTGTVLAGGLGAPAPELVPTEGLGVSATGPVPPEELGAPAPELVLTEGLGVLMEGAVPSDEFGDSVAATVLGEAPGVSVSAVGLGEGVVESVPEPDVSAFVAHGTVEVENRRAGQMGKSQTWVCASYSCLCELAVTKLYDGSAGHGAIAITATLFCAKRFGMSGSIESRNMKSNSPELRANLHAERLRTLVRRLPTECTPTCMPHDRVIVIIPTLPSNAALYNASLLKTN